MRIYTFEALTKTGEWKPVFCVSGNGTDKETGCSLIVCKTARPYKEYTASGARDTLSYFQSKIGVDKVRVKR